MQPDEQPDRPAPTRPRILAIEDDVDAASLMADVLDEHFKGPCVTAATSIEHALTHDLANFDLVLSDFNLPDGNGLDAITRIFERRKDMPCIMVTGEAGITTALNALKLGAYDYVVKTSELLSVLPLAVEKNLQRWAMQQENERLHAELKASLEDARFAQAQLSHLVSKLEEMALTDVLTGLSNRRHVSDILPRMFAESLRYNTNITCAMIDLDGFKEANDTQGHQCGDEILDLAGAIISANRRDSDVAARYGGDEFVILMPQTSQDTAMNLVRRIVEQFEMQVQRKVGSDLRVTMSVGVASRMTSQVSKSEKLLNRADELLYFAKNAGKATIVSDEGPGQAPTAIGLDGRTIVLRPTGELAA